MVKRTARTPEQGRRRLLDDDDADTLVKPRRRLLDDDEALDSADVMQSPVQTSNSQKEPAPSARDKAEKAAILRLAKGNKEQAEVLEKAIQSQTMLRYTSAMALENAANMLFKAPDPSKLTREYLERRRRIEITDAVLNEVLHRVRQGQSVYRICKDDDDMPSYERVITHLNSDGWKELYAAARVSRVERMGEEITEATSELQRLVAAGASSEVVNAAKLHVDSLKWIMARMDPANWGDRQQVDLKADVKVKQEGDIDSRLLALLSKGGAIDAPTN